MENPQQRLKQLLIKFKESNERTFLFSPELREMYVILHELDGHYEWGPDTEFEDIYKSVKK